MDWRYGRSTLPDGTSDHGHAARPAGSQPVMDIEDHPRQPVRLARQTDPLLLQVHLLRLGEPRGLEPVPARHFQRSQVGVLDSEP